MTDVDGAPKLKIPLGRVNEIDIFADESMPKSEPDPAYAEQIRGLREMTDLLNKQAPLEIQSIKAQQIDPFKSNLSGYMEQPSAHENKHTEAGRSNAFQLMPENTPIGSKLRVAEYASALEKIGGAAAAMVVLPRGNTDYIGKIIQFSDTHLVQQASKSIAVAHDIQKLANGADLLQQAVAGKVQGKVFVIQYGKDAGRASLAVQQPIKVKPATVLEPVPHQPTQGMKR